MIESSIGRHQSTIGTCLHGIQSHELDKKSWTNDHIDYFSFTEFVSVGYEYCHWTH